MHTLSRTLSGGQNRRVHKHLRVTAICIMLLFFVFGVNNLYALAEEPQSVFGYELVAGAPDFAMLWGQEPVYDGVAGSLTWKYDYAEHGLAGMPDAVTAFLDNLRSDTEGYAVFASLTVNGGTPIGGLYFNEYGDGFTIFGVGGTYFVDTEGVIITVTHAALKGDAIPEYSIDFPGYVTLTHTISGGNGGDDEPLSVPDFPAAEYRSYSEEMPYLQFTMTATEQKSYLSKIQSVSLEVSGLGGELDQLSIAELLLIPGYFINISNNTLTVYSDLLASVDIDYTITISAYGYAEDKVITQDGDIAPLPLDLVGITALGIWNNVPMEWRFADHNWSPKYAANFCDNLEAIIVDGVRYERTTGELSATNPGFIVRTYSLEVGSMTALHNVSDFNYSATYSNVTFVMNVGDDIVLTGKAPDNTAPTLIQSNLSPDTNRTNAFSAAWDVSGNSQLTRYFNSIYSVAVSKYNGESWGESVVYSPLSVIPDSTQVGFFVSQSGTRYFAVGIDPFYGDYKLVVSAAGYLDQTIIIDNEDGVERGFIAPGFDLTLSMADGLLYAPEGIEDSILDDDAFANYYAWWLPSGGSVIYCSNVAVEDRATVEEYISMLGGESVEIIAYTDMYPEGIQLTCAPKLNDFIGNSVAHNYSYYSYDGKTSPVETKGLFVRTNGVIMSYTGDPATDRINKLEINNVDGYEDHIFDFSDKHSERKFAVNMSPTANVQRDKDSDTGEKSLTKDVEISYFLEGYQSDWFEKITGAEVIFPYSMVFEEYVVSASLQIGAGSAADVEIKSAPGTPDAPYLVRTTNNTGVARTIRLTLFSPDFGAANPPEYTLELSYKGQTVMLSYNSTYGYTADAGLECDPFWATPVYNASEKTLTWSLDFYLFGNTYAGAESFLGKVKVPDKRSVRKAATVFLINGADFTVQNGKLTINPDVFLGTFEGTYEVSELQNGFYKVPNTTIEKPVLTAYNLRVSADGYFDSLASQFIGSTDPFDAYSNETALIIRFEDEEISISERELYFFAAANKYVVDGEDLTYNATRGTMHFNDIHAVDIGKLFKDFQKLDANSEPTGEAFGVDIYELLKDTSKFYEISITATDGWGATHALEFIFGIERPYFPSTYSDYYLKTGSLEPVQTAALLINLDYENGTLMMGTQSPGADYDKGFLSRSMKALGVFHTAVQMTPGLIEIKSVANPGQEAAPSITMIGDREIAAGTYGTLAEPISAYIGEALSFGDGRAVYYSMAWAEAGDPGAPGTVVYDSAHRYYPQYMNFYKDMRTNIFAQAGVVRIAVGVAAANGPASDTVEYVFCVDKGMQDAPVGLTGGEAVINGTTTAMEYRLSTESVWNDCNELTTYVSAGAYYVRYKETGALYASPETTVAIDVTAPTKGFQQAPAGLTSTAPEGSYQLGEINGTTVAMEYRSVSDVSAAWKACLPTVTFADSGTYYVRYKETSSLYASPPVTVEVGEYVPVYTGVHFEIVDQRAGREAVYQITDDVLEDLGALLDISYDFSTVNTYGSFETRTGYGPSLTALLNQFGINDIQYDQLLTFIAADGYSASATWGYLSVPRYYYPNANSSNVKDGMVTNPVALTGKIQVPVIINTTYGDGTLMFGQVHPNEETQNLFVGQIDKYQASTNTVGQIIITDEKSEQYSLLSPDMSSHAPGIEVDANTKISFNEEELRRGYIYYTFDMDNEDPVYTWNFYNWQMYERGKPTEKFNNPLITDGATSFKAAVYGYLGATSEVSYFGYALSGATVVDPGDGGDIGGPSGVNVLAIYNGSTLMEEFTKAELDALIGSVNHYSSMNTWPSYDSYLNVSGVDIMTLLSQSGITGLDDNQEITFYGADNFNVTLRIADLVATRYFFSSSGSQGASVPAVLSINNESLRIFFGQLTAQEQTSQAFVKNVNRIVVGGDAGTYGSVTANPSSGTVAAGSEIRLRGYSGDAKIYYTLDGSDPTMESAMYNISADRWLYNKGMTEHDPIIVPGSGEFTIKAQIIGLGKEPGPIMTFTYNTGGGTPGGSVPTPPSGDSVLDLTATVNAGIGTATVSASVFSTLINATAAIGSSAMAEIKISAAGNAKMNRVETRLPVVGIREAAEKTGGLVVNTPVGQLGFDNAALTAIAAAAGSADEITIIISEADVSKLTAEQKKAVGDRPVYELTILCNGKEITTFGAGKITVTLPYALGTGESADGIVIYYLKADGTLEKVSALYSRATGMVTFITTHFSYFIIGYDAGLADWGNPFKDVAAKDWFYESVRYAYENKLMIGTGDTEFSPNMTTQRGMIATILWRLEGEPTAKVSAFTDVERSQYYAAAIDWAAEKEIVNGYGNNLFGPQDAITREQMAAILYRYAKYKGYDISAIGNMSSFADANKISDYASDAMKWAVGSGLIIGTSDTTVEPQGNATRAQVATILQRFIETFVK